MSLSFFRHLAHALQSGSVVVATVIHAQGSVPREVGARLLLGSDGQLFGTIGGGAGEARVIQQARVVLETGMKQRVEIDLSGAPQRETHGVCGGLLWVWLERWQGEGAIALVEQILTRLQAGCPVRLIMPLEQTRSPYLGDLDNNEQPLLTSTSTASVFQETLQPPPTLLIVGAGHCGIQLAKVADLIGFQVMVQDDRPEWANPQHYPQAIRIFNEAIAIALEQLVHHAQLYVALLTRGYLYDLEALNALLQRTIPCQYLGMIGSQKRVRQVIQAIAKTGVAEDQLQSIHAPIGLDIGALTPAEIAVSIAAELVLVRRGGTGQPLSIQFKQHIISG